MSHRTLARRTQQCHWENTVGRPGNGLLAGKALVIIILRHSRSGNRRIIGTCLNGAGFFSSKEHSATVPFHAAVALPPFSMRSVASMLSRHGQLPFPALPPPSGAAARQAAACTCSPRPAWFSPSPKSCCKGWVGVASLLTILPRLNPQGVGVIMSVFYYYIFLLVLGSGRESGLCFHTDMNIQEGNGRRETVQQQKGTGSRQEKHGVQVQR